jgi:arylsulfate sulfotransferase
MTDQNLPNAVWTAILFTVSGLALGCGVSNQTWLALPGTSIAGTQNPLVARYYMSAPCPGQAMVEFGTDTSYGRSTSWQSVPGRHQTTSILVAGMRASTTYHMRATLQCFGRTVTSVDQTFTTGALPSTPFPSISVVRPDPSLSSQENPGIELVNVFAPKSNFLQAIFSDRDGHPLWYYDVGAADGNAPYTMKMLPNGHMIFSITRSVTAGTVLREVDLAGTTVRELDTGVLAQRMQQAGFNFVITGFHHDVLPLDNGHLIVLGNFFQGLTDLPGYPGTTQVLGDAIVDLDENWNPVWAWSAFDHLDVNRHLNGLPDWTHGNAVVLTPQDGNLLLSMRHQSWVIKIDYNHGQGTGNVLWKLGYQGDLALRQGADPSLWFSYQHFPSIIGQDGSQTSLVLWDNGDARVLDSNGALCTNPAMAAPNPCYARAQVFQLDENAKVADLTWQALPGYLSIWGGSVSQLPNGNVEFDMNAPGLFPIANLASEVQEVTRPRHRRLSGKWTSHLCPCMPIGLIGCRVCIPG